MVEAITFYKMVLRQDSTHVEAIACIGANHFYTDQPEIALRYYRCQRAELETRIIAKVLLFICFISCHVFRILFMLEIYSHP